MAKPHHQLAVWQRSINLVKGIYQLTEEFPESEKFGLISQMRRAAVSIPSNIAEGAARNSRKEFINFLHIAQGSIAELETQILISQELGFVKVDSVNSLLQEMDEISKMIIGLQRSLKTVTSNKSVVTRKKEVED
jgi:four helix bundle protein